MKITDDVLAVLSTMTCEGNLARITAGQLERKLYERTNAVLVELGGQWNRKTKAHVFPADAAERIDGAIVAGAITTAKELGYFATPAGLARKLVERADVRAGMRALEPSAGEGAIAHELTRAGALVTCVELDAGRCGELRAVGFDPVICADFLSVRSDAPPRAFDRVVMNPPFARQQDIAHVLHALTFLAPTGRLVAVMSAGVAFRQDRRAREFRDLVAARGGSIDPLPEGAFRASGTDVRTVVVTIEAAT